MTFQKKFNAKNDMKKGRFMIQCLLISIVLTCVLLPGCRQEKFTPLTFESEDSLQGNPSYVSNYSPDGSNVMQLGNGIYYNEGTPLNLLNLHYYDFSTQKDILLCNKPECKHDGNEFCVATNAKYHPIAFQAYNGSIFATAYCLDEEKLEFKLLCFAPDGSNLMEITTYYSTTSANIESIPCQLGSGNDSDRFGYSFLLIHRNKAYLPFCFHSENSDEDINSFGLMEFDLNTKELTSAYEEIASESNAPWYHVSARGDYVYYVTDEPHKHLLHRRSILDSTDEIVSQIPGFTGDYAVYDDNHVAYVKNLGTLVLHNLQDGSNEEPSLISQETLYIGKAASPEGANEAHNLEKGGTFTCGDETIEYGFLEAIPYNYKVADITTDGTYLYVAQMPGISTEYGTPLYAWVHVFNTDMEEIAVARIPNPHLLLGEPCEIDYNLGRYGLHISLNYLGDQVYLCYKDEAFSCTMDSFLSGEPQFTHLCHRKFAEVYNP